MSAIPTTPADELSRESDADFLARLEEDLAAPAPEPADETPPPARAEDAASPAPEGGEQPAAAPVEDPIQVARREAREEAAREYQAKLDGVHGNVKQWQAVARQLAEQVEAADKKREVEYQQLIDATQDPEQRRHWQEQAGLEKRAREVERREAQIALRQQLAEAQQQQAAQQGEQGARGLMRESLFKYIDVQGREQGLAPEDMAAIRADIEALPILGVLSDAPLNFAIQSHQQTGRWLERRVDEAAARRAQQRETRETATAQANRQRDAQTGRFAAGQPGATGAGGDRYARMSDTEFLALVEDQE